MSDAPRGPRVILEEEAAPAPRLDLGWEQAVVPVAPARPPGWSSLGLASVGVAVLVLGFSALEAANFIAAQFDRGAIQGWLTAGVALLGYGLIGWGGLRELRGLAALSQVDTARAAFARNDFDAAKREAVRWAGTVAAAAPILPALRECQDIASLRALLQGGPLAVLDAEAAALGRGAALQAFGITAVSPSPSLDAVVFGWRGIRLVRQVAALHGLRPGLAGTLALLRRTLFDAAQVAATDIAVDTAARALLSNKLLEQFAGEAAAGAVAARRMLRLARAAATACRLLPP